MYLEEFYHKDYFEKVIVKAMKNIVASGNLMTVLFPKKNYFLESIYMKKQHFLSILKQTKYTYSYNYTSYEKLYIRCALRK